MRAFKSLFTRLVGSVLLPTAIVVGSFYVFNSLGKVHFLVAISLAFCIGAYAIYLIFKYWVNASVERETPEEQLKRYSIVFIVNLAIYMQIVYYLVTYAYVPLLTAQAIAAIIVAYESFYAYRSLVLRMRKKRRTVADQLKNSSTPTMERI